jgi:hypothetical protein
MALAVQAKKTGFGIGLDKRNSIDLSSAEPVSRVLTHSASVGQSPVKIHEEAVHENEAV